MTRATKLSQEAAVADYASNKTNTTRALLRRFIRNKINYECIAE